MKSRIPGVVLFVLLGTIAWFGWQALRGDDARVVAAPQDAPASSESQVASLDLPSIEARARDSVSEPTVPEEDQAVVPSATPPAECALRILDPNGAVAASVEVFLRSSAKEQRFVSDAAGIARIPLADFVGDWLLHAQDGDRAASGDLGPRSFPGGPGTARDLQLYALVTVRGRVETNDGVPVTNASVSVSRRGTILLGGTPRAREGIAVDEAGRFECVIEALAGQYDFTATVPDSESCSTSAVIDRESRDEIVLRCFTPGGLRGVVVDPMNRVVEGATVHLLRYDEQGRPMDRRKPRQVSTDAQGAFRFDVEEAAGWFAIATSDAWCASEAVEADPTANFVSSITLRLVEPQSISGELVQGDGSPAAGIAIFALRDKDQPTEPGALFGEDNMLLYGLGQTHSDEAGHFEFDRIRPGAATYMLVIAPDPKQRDRKLEVQGVLPGTSDLRIVVSDEALRGGVIEARVIFSDSGDSLQSGTWILFEKLPLGDWMQTGVRSFEGGVLRREGLRPGVEYCAVVQPIGGYFSALIPAWTAELGVHSIDAVLWRAQPIEIRTPPEIAIAAGDTLVIHAVDPHPEEMQSWTVRVEQGGSLQTYLRPGEYRAQRADGASNEFRFTVTSDFNVLLR